MRHSQVLAYLADELEAEDLQEVARLQLLEGADRIVEDVAAVNLDHDVPICPRNASGVHAILDPRKL